MSLALIAGVSAHFFLCKIVWEQRKDVRHSVEAGYVLPSPFIRIATLGHKGLFADYLFLEVSTFYGERQMCRENMISSDWDYLVAGLGAVTDLDPYFLDPYVFAEGTLTWGVRRINDVNILLEKGRKYRTWDWQIPYYLGFNYFYFLKDYPKGAQYLMEASKLPGHPEFLPQLAARLGYYGGRSKTAILFLKGLILETSDEVLKKTLLRRQSALERAVELENMVGLFIKQQGRKPVRIEELVTAGYIDTLPLDPYGGQWIILKNGRVFSTSKFTDSR